ncbi:glycosyltransferase family 2 protein [Psychrobacter okhotskensis]|uniref:glycosyltransferase family 2 protein n=1 Tax=Psychrobacter okhotskensis TaxID=212403 RepID=UPI0019185A18|nr:glycosyltransferase [Psychrobacter okhotskensis]
MVQPFITLITPIYNGQFHLKGCVDSIVKAAVNYNIELILVDDGSTDDSLEIAKEYSNSFSWIKTIQQHNQGPSSARNAGLNIARGEYIGFVDCDDCISENYFSELFSASLIKPDIIVFGYERISLNGDRQAHSPMNKLHTKDLELLLCNVNSDRELFWSSSTKIFKATLISNIRFDRHMRLGEDTVFNLNAVLNSQKILRIDYVLYFYYEVDGSLSSSIYKENLIENMERHFSSRLSVNKRTSCGLNAKAWEDIYNYYIFHILPWLFSNSMHLDKRQQLRELKEIRDLNFVIHCYSKSFSLGKSPRMILIQFMFRMKLLYSLRVYLSKIH